MKIDIFMNAKSLMYLLDQRELNMQQRRLMEFLGEYTFDIRYTPSKGNVVVDALSRRAPAQANWILMLDERLIHELDVQP